MEGQIKPAPEGAQQFSIKPVDARGIYAPSQRITIATPDDVIKAGISVSYKAAEQTWGREAADRLREADAAVIRSRIENRGIPVNRIPKTGAIFSR